MIINVMPHSLGGVEATTPEPKEGDTRISEKWMKLNSNGKIFLSTIGLHKFRLLTVAILMVLFQQSILAVESDIAPPPDDSDIQEVEQHANSDGTVYESMMLLVSVMQLLQRYYVEPAQVSYKRLVKSAMTGMLRELDPYSSYEAPKEHQERTVKFSGKIVGIGVVVVRAETGLKIVAIVDESPAERAGLKKGDIITAVDGMRLNKLSLTNAVNLLKGKPDTVVRLKIMRPNEAQSLIFDIRRKVIRHSSVPYNGIKVFSEDIGYIKLDIFTMQTGNDLDRALEQLEKQKIRGLILDVRNNPGGLLKAAVDVASRFLTTGSPVIITEGREANSKQAFTAVNCRKQLELPVIILINRYSASAAEIVAGCLRDSNRALLVGERSFGKGSVQRVYRLPNRGAVKFTIARYYTPKRLPIHEQGIGPDIEVTTSPPSPPPEKYLSFPPNAGKPQSGEALIDAQLRQALEKMREMIKAAGSCLKKSSKSKIGYNTWNFLTDNGKNRGR